MRECVDPEDSLEKEVLQEWQDSLEPEENKDLLVPMDHQGSQVQKVPLDIKDRLAWLVCPDNVACLDHRVQREAVVILVFLALREMQESKEKEDNRVLQDHPDLLVRLVALEILDLLVLLEKQEQQE